MSLHKEVAKSMYLMNIKNSNWISILSSITINVLKDFIKMVKFSVKYHKLDKVIMIQMEIYNTMLILQLMANNLLENLFYLDIMIFDWKK